MLGQNLSFLILVFCDPNLDAKSKSDEANKFSSNESECKEHDSFCLKMNESYKAKKT